MKKLFALSLFVLLALPFSNRALADAAPAAPPYPNVKLNVKVGLGNFDSKYVIIEETNRYGTYYSLANNLVSPNGYGATTYFALDKNYLTSNGGIDNLFTTTGSEEDTTMSPKDSKSFSAHSYNFLIAKNDTLLKSEFGGSQLEAVDSQYVKFPFRSDFYIRQGPDDESCETGYNNGTKNCAMGEKTLTYLPKQVLGNNIVLVNADTLNQAPNQNIQSPTPTSQPEASTPPHIPWYKKFWNFIKSLF